MRCMFLGILVGTMRATVLRTLLDADNYNSAPNAVFALLVPPNIDPVFAL